MNYCGYWYYWYHSNLRSGVCDYEDWDACRGIHIVCTHSQLQSYTWNIASNAPYINHITLVRSDPILQTVLSWPPCFPQSPPPQGQMLLLQKLGLLSTECGIVSETQTLPQPTCIQSNKEQDDIQNWSKMGYGMWKSTVEMINLKEKRGIYMFEWNQLSLPE